MTRTPNVATVASSAGPARCRMVDRLGDRCTGLVISEDIKDVQICPRHGLAAARLLAEAGAIQIRYADVTARRTA